MDFASKLTARAKLMELEAVGQILKAAGDPSIISLAGGLPANEVFPIEVIGELSAKVLRDHRFAALQYGRAMGFPPLREAVAEYMTQRGIPAQDHQAMEHRQGVCPAGQVTGLAAGM